MIFCVNDQMAKPLHPTFCISVFIENLEKNLYDFLDGNCQSNFVFCSTPELHVIITIILSKNIYHK